jgi:hypothetical protein
LGRAGNVSDRSFASRLRQCSGHFHSRLAFNGRWAEPTLAVDNGGFDWLDSYYLKLFELCQPKFRLSFCPRTTCGSRLQGGSALEFSNIGARFFAAIIDRFGGSATGTTT